MKHRVSHPLDRPSARRALDEAFAEYRERFRRHEPSLRWTAPDEVQVSFHALDRSFEARVHLLDQALEIEMNVPLLARPFVSRAKRRIEREVSHWAQSHSGGG